MASIRFAVLEDGETLIGQAFLPVAHLRPGYRHIVLRNAMNLPTHASSLFVYIQRSVYVDVDHQKMADRLTTPLSSHSADDDETSRSTLNIPANYMVRIHQRTEDESRLRTTPSLAEESKRYQTHLIAASHLHDRKTLCKPLALTDFEKREVYQRERDGRKERLQRISSEFQKVGSRLSIPLSLIEPFSSRRFSTKKNVFRRVSLVHERPACRAKISNNLFSIYVESNSIINKKPN